MTGVLRAAKAEWTKLRTVRGTAWLTLALVVCTVAVGAAVTASLDTRFCDTGCDQDNTRLSLSGVYLGQLAVVVFGVLAVTNEYATGMARTTLMTNPRRVTVFAARAAVVTATVLGGGLLGVLGSLGAARLILPGHGFTAANGYPPPSLADEPTLRAAVGTLLYFALVALLSLGVGTAVRDTAGAISILLGLLYAFPLIGAFINDPHWQERLQKLSPMTAGLAVQATKHLDALPIGPWAGLGVIAGYAAVALAAGAAAFVIRDG